MNDLELRRNPFVGLRPFFVEDSLYFFGREQQTGELLQILHEHRFLGVVGSSGSGKSSLVRAGLLPALLGGFLVRERDRWHIAQMRPGDAPVENLAESLVRAMARADETDVEHAVIDELTRKIREEHTDAVVEFLEARLRSNANVFLLVDQFEEVFAFRGAERDEADESDPARRRERARRKAEAADFVDLILALAKQRRLPVYVALTMRTDFLGDCDLFYGLPEALNRGRYLVPRMTRQQLAKAIEAPAKLLRAHIAPRLLDQLLNELGDRFDRLPVLQHALLRTWDAWQEAGGIGPVDLQHYQSAGGLERALDWDAERALDGLDVDVIERVFKRLTGTDRNQRRVRSPARISELMVASGADRRALAAIVRRFEEDGRSFLHESDDGQPDDPRVDISHESLIRQWDRLRRWVDEERDSRDHYVELVERARKWERGETVLLVDPELQTTLGWRKRASWSVGWAGRYAFGKGDFPRAMAYLAKSVEKRRAKRASLVFVALALFAAALWMAVGIVRHEELAEREAFWREAPDAARDARLFGFLGHMYASLESGDVQAAKALLDGLDTLKKESRPQGDGLPKEKSAWDDWDPGKDDRSIEKVLRDRLKTEADLLLQANAADLASRGPRAPIYDVVLGGNGDFALSTLRDGTVRLWHPGESDKVLDLPGCGLQPREALARLQRPRTVAAAYNPAAKLYAVACSDGSLPERTQSSAVDIAVIGPVPRDVLSLSFSPGGEYLVTGSLDGTASVWEISEVQEPAKGRKAGSADPKSGRRFSLGRHPVAVLRGHSDAISSVAFESENFSAGEYRVVTGSRDRTARVWKVKGPSIERTEPLRGHTDWVTSALFGLALDTEHKRLTPRVVTTSYDGTTRIWDAGDPGPAGARRGQPVLIQNRTEGVASAALSRDGEHVVTALREGSVWRTDAAGGSRKEIGRLPLRLDRDRFISRLNFEIADKLVRKAELSERERERIELSKDEQGLVAFYDELFSGRKREARETLGRLDREQPYGATARSVWRLSGELDDKNLIRGLSNAGAPDDKGPDPTRVQRIAGLTAGYRAQFLPYSGRVGLRGHEGIVTGAAFSPDGRRLVTASYDGTARVWDAATGTQLFVLKVDRPDKLTSARFSPDGASIVTTSYDAKVRLWSAADGKPIAVLAEHKEAVYSAAIGADGKLLASGARDGLLLWTLAASGDSWNLQPTGAAAAPCGPGEEGDAARRHSVASVAFSADGKRLVTASNDRTVRVCEWNGKSLERIFQTPSQAAPCDGRLGGHCDTVHSAAFSPDGRYVVTASYDRTVRVWDAAKGQELAVLGEHRGRVYSAAFNPRDASRIVTASADGFVRIWRLSPAAGTWTVSLVQDFAAQGGSSAGAAPREAFSAAWSPDGVRLVVTSADGIARILGERLDVANFATPLNYEVACALAKPELECRPLPPAQRALSAPEEARLLASAYYTARRPGSAALDAATCVLDASSKKSCSDLIGLRYAFASQLDSSESGRPATSAPKTRPGRVNALVEFVRSGGVGQTSQPKEQLKAVASLAAASWLLCLILLWPLWRGWVWYARHAGASRRSERAANPVRRALAAVADLAAVIVFGLVIGGLVGILAWIFLSAAGAYPGYRGWNIGAAVFVFASAAYLLLRDASLSPGKMLFGLRSVTVATPGERQVGVEQSVLRNVFTALFYLLALLPCAALVLGADLFVAPAGAPSSGWRDAGYLLLGSLQSLLNPTAWGVTVAALTVLGIVELVLSATAGGRTLHDRVAKTGVVDVRRKAHAEAPQEAVQTAAA